ncbi:hypothetical protein JCM11251_000764 [Rhodosporidiobolus azoricus]
MPFVKVQKNDAYFSRYQVKYRRRREGKTDYYARKRLVAQAKNKYATPKYRLVVRITNKDVVCQIVSSKLQGDIVLCAAYSHELPKYGIKHGLTNWAACYATGLLCARRALTKLGLADKYEGVTEPSGELELTEPIEGQPRPFKCFLDVGLARTSTGARVFGAMKGASDGGIFIPHSEGRFPGFDPESKELDAETLQRYIYGGHVAEFMESLEEEDEERFRKHFARYLEDDISSEDIEDIYREAHEKIRENPEFVATEKADLAKWKEESKKYHPRKLSLQEKRKRVEEKKAAYYANKDIIVYGDSAGPLGSVVIEQVVVVDEQFKVALEQTDGSRFVVSLSSPSSLLPFADSASSTSTDYSFTSPAPLPSPATEFLDAVKRCQLQAAKQKLRAADEEGKRWQWARKYTQEPGSLGGDGSRGSRRLGSGFEGSLGAAYGARRIGGSHAPLSSLDWSAAHSSSSIPGSFSPLSPQPSASPIAERGEESLYSNETHSAMERWLVQRMREREDEFLKKGELSVWCSTFNVNDKQPKNGASDIQGWVDSSDGAELLVFGFQELDLTTEALLRYTPHRGEVWRRAIEEALGKKDGALKYEKLHSRQLVGALILVYARADIREHISEVASASLATGLMGLVANKGGVGVRLKYKDTPLTFINSHLAAFTENVAQRNAQVRDTASTLLFPLEEGKNRDPWTPNLRPDAVRPSSLPGRDGYSVWEAETLVWMGDLNYRIDLPRKEVDRMIEGKEWELLQRFDQLRIQRHHHLAFADFEEARIDFPPSFKFDIGTQTYDTSEKQRVPSWTDRILALPSQVGAVKFAMYQSHPDILMSDHKPVSVMLRVPVYSAFPDKRSQIQQEVIAELDSFDNDALPDVKLSPGPSIEFDQIRYDEPVTKTVEVVNVGEVLAAWSFVCKPDTSAITPPWLHISPCSGLMLPNERTPVTLTIHITSSSASSLNFPPPGSPTDASLSDLLIISFKKKDLFLSVSAREWIPTVFGSDLECLARLHEPIRSLSLEKRTQVAAAAAGKGVVEGGGKVAVPQVLHRLIGFLAEYALAVKALFIAAGEGELVKVVRECLDTGADFPLDRLIPGRTFSTGDASGRVDGQELFDAVDTLDHLDLESDIGSISLSSPALAPPINVGRARATSSASASALFVKPRSIREEDDGRNIGLHSVADCVLRLLESLAEPVVTIALYARAIEAETRDEAYAVVRALPEAHADTLLYIVAFLRVLLQQTTNPVEKTARMDRLAVVFSAVLLRPSPSPDASEKVDPASIPRRSKTFVLMLLQEDEAETAI